MSIEIKDGTGAGSRARVDSKNRLRTLSVTRTALQSETIVGDSYNFNSGDITFTGSTSSAIQYLKNTGEYDIIVTSLTYLIGNTTNGSGSDAKVDILRNPTAGRIVDNALSVAPVNKNFGSAQIATATTFTGSEADTFTDGTVAASSRLATVGREVVVYDIVIPNGGSIGIRYTPPAGNTSQTCQFVISFYENKTT